MAGLNTEYLEEGLWSIVHHAACNDMLTVDTIARDLINHINESLE